MEKLKSLKDYCKDAKKRLKNGFWQKYKQDLSIELDKAQEAGVSVVKVKEYYAQRISGSIRKSQDDDQFYKKVKKILDEEGEISNASGRLTDKDVYASLSYEEQQRYTLDLSAQYLKAVERYKKEKAMLFNG